MKIVVGFIFVLFKVKLIQLYIYYNCNLNQNLTQLRLRTFNKQIHDFQYQDEDINYMKVENIFMNNNVGNGISSMITKLWVEDYEEGFSQEKEVAHNDENKKIVDGTFGLTIREKINKFEYDIQVIETISKDGSYSEGGDGFKLGD